MAERTDNGLIAASAKRGILVVGAGQVARILVHVAGLVVMARLLTPGDYGLMAMTVAVVGVGEVFRDFGFSNAAIQAETVSEEERSKLFWINLSLGVVLAVLLLLAGPTVANAFDEPRLQNLFPLLASTFIFNGLSTQHKAALNREMKFGSMTVAELTGQISGLTVGVILAFQDYGYWALGWQQVVSSAAMGLCLVAADPWVPHRYRRSTNIGKYNRYAWPLLGAQLVTYASNNIDKIVLGLRVGPQAVGLYDRAYQILMLPLNQIRAPATRVALPVLSRLTTDVRAYTEFLLRGQSVLMHVLLFIFSLGAATAFISVPVVLGQQWEASVVLFQILAVAGAAQTCSYFTYWVFISQGLNGWNFLYSLATRTALIVMIIIGSQWGVEGVALAYSSGLLAIWPVGLLLIGKISTAPARLIFWSGLRALLMHSLAGAAAFGVAAAVYDDAVVGTLLLAAVAYSSVVVAVAGLSKSTRNELFAVIAIVTSLGVSSKRRLLG